jgi:hypothetical protein
VVASPWQPFDKAAEAEQMHLLNDVYVEAWRKLAPDMGSYINEVRLPPRCSKPNY